jgi:hypothetical protein
MTMLTNCAKCKHIQPINLVQLRSYRGMMRCEKCLSMFDALEHLREATEANENVGHITETTNNKVDIELEMELGPESIHQTLAWEQPQTTQTNPKWFGTGIATAALILAGQLAYFNADKLLTAPSSRAWLERICKTLSCQLPTYRNLQEFLVLQGQLTPLANNNINFKSAISNQAAFAQTYPKLKLTLLDFAGNAFAQRIFQPKEYLKPDTGPIIAAKATVEISLQIAATKNEIGGYNFDLTY